MNTKEETMRQPRNTGYISKRGGNFNFQVSQIKAFLEKHGRSTIGDTTFELKSPTYNNPDLLNIINDPTVTIEPVGKVTKDSNSEFRLTAQGKSVNIKIYSTKTH